ncbi:MAG: ABC transporter substrate-binding protein [Hydrogenophaga sp.]|jgi:branched-chain amino acid transport system substrate-binding protein|uniref:ABC transporter substrate-binding protein n=1 Tax=Hydrogenophaga sp. TaxID=1904254 RepID=UPI002A35B722|nr:ABC transporter substrate-binding protein [Hydrogenophaga sp.]MDX9968378.1 ABC transporter substrate-binding protein [Hydrogenophaga sp.]
MRTSASLLAAALLGASLGASAQEKVTVAFTGTLTGDFASYGVTGKQGFDLAIEAYNAQKGPQVEVTVVDDHGNPGDAVMAANRFCADKNMSAVVGYTFSSVALAAMPILDKCKLPVIGTAVTSPQLSGTSPYFRRVALTDATQGKLMGEYVAKTLGLKNIYLLYQQDDYGIGVQQAFKAAFEAAGGKLMGNDPYMLGTKDFRTLLTRVKSKKPEGIFIAGFYTEAASLVAQAKAMRINARMLANDGSLSPQLMALSNGAAEGMTLYGTFDPGASTEASPVAASFVKTFVAKYKTEPDSWAALGYDAGLALTAAIDAAKTQGGIDRARLHARLGALSGLPGATGQIQFEPSGDRKASVLFFNVQNGKFTLAK